MQLLERSSAGLDVTVDYLPYTHVLVLRCTCNGELAETEIPADRVLDAFHHPACYLNKTQQAQLFQRQPDN